MGLAADLGAIREIAGAAPGSADYDRELLTFLDRRVGIDTGMTIRDGGPGAFAVGIDRAVSRRCAPLWGRFVADASEVLAAAEQAGGVAVDLAVLGERRLERASFYQHMMRPHGGRCTALVPLAWRGQVAATLSLGRCARATFRDRELAYLRALVPTLALGEIARRAPAPVAPALRADALRLTPREREVLGYLRLGYSNEQIARACGNAPRTVRNQLSRVYAALGVATRAEAVAVALALGLDP